MGTKIDKAVSWAINIAKSSSHGYDQINRWGPDYDCSSLVISAYQQAGVPVKSNGATYTGNMYSVFKKCGFSDVTKSINLSTGSGLITGDVLLDVSCHTAMMINSKQLVEASINENGKITGGRQGDQTGREIRITNYYNYTWDYVLRYTKESASSDTAFSESSSQWLPLYDTSNSREDATIREIGFVDKSNKPSIYTSSIKLSTINYTTLLGSVFDIFFSNSTDASNTNTNKLGAVPGNIVDYLINKGLNTAASVGIIANIYYESNFNTAAVGDNGTSFGICQWHNARGAAMKKTAGSDWKTNLSGQLDYLWYELNHSYKNVLTQLKSVPNTKAGAMTASDIFVRKFEVPANVSYQSTLRQSKAAEYWELIS